MKCGEMCMSTTSQLVGNCTNDPYPDTWFPETENGRQSNAKLRLLAKDIKYARDKCATCPVKESCLEEGMQINNLPFGIWGGKLAAERIEAYSGSYEGEGIQTDVTKALVFYRLVSPFLEE